MNKLDFNYNFALDQNYKDLNYNEVGFNVNLNPIKFDIDYLQEKNTLVIKNTSKLVHNTQKVIMGFLLLK